eukprot:6184600-Pleurochrysis_carterae.AAC.3
MRQTIDRVGDGLEIPDEECSRISGMAIHGHSKNCTTLGRCSDADGGEQLVVRRTWPVPA